MKNTLRRHYSFNICDFILWLCKNNAGVVLPPSRIGTDGTTSTLLEERYTFETAYSASGTVYT